jgi:hypothetical protein
MVLPTEEEAKLQIEKRLERHPDLVYETLKAWSYCSCDSCLGSAMLQAGLNPSKPPDMFMLQRNKISCPTLFKLREQIAKLELEIRELKKVSK